MRKVIAVIIAVLILSVPGVVFAQMEHGEGMMDDKGMPKKDHGMKGCPMMKHMMGPMVIPTSDGGVVVVTGNKMTKYDQDLDMIGQAEIKMMDKMADEPQAAAAVEPAAESAAATEPAAVAEPAAEAKPEAATEPAVVAEPAAEFKPEAAAEPAAIVIEPAAEEKPAVEEPAAVTNSTVPAEEGNHTEQK
jgi:hypothetical protein